MMRRPAAVLSCFLLLMMAPSLGCFPKKATRPARTTPAVDPVPPANTKPTVEAETVVAETTAPEDSSCSTQQTYDTDGDGISDPIEALNAKRRYADLLTGRCDDNPTEVVGRPNKGKISGALNLPDKGDGYVHFLGTDASDKDDWGSLTLLTCIEQVGRRLKETGITLNVGDLSLREGGRFPPHASHQNGLDIDLRYVRRDRRSAPLDLRYQRKAYDAEATKKVITAFLALCPVRLVFMDVQRIGFDLEDNRIFHARGHSNHAHIRLDEGASKP